MKPHNRIFLVGLISIVLYGVGMITSNSSKNIATRKTILICSCKGGKAHERTAEALKTLLSPTYNITIVDTFNEICPSVDLCWSFTNAFPLNLFFTKPVFGQDIYNFLLQKRWLFLANKLLRAGNWWLRYNDRIEKRAKRYFNKIKPDVVISVIPTINHGLLRAAKDSNIPFILTTLDLNPTYWANGITKEDSSYKKFIYAIPFNDESVKKATLQNNINKSAIKISGYPVQEAFYQKYDISALKKKHHVPENKPVIMLMMGGIGSSAIITYAEYLMRLKNPFHLIVCLGTSEHLKSNIEEIKKPKDVSTSIFTFTNDIAELMAVSNVLITKAGANSVAEALHMKLPIIIDQTEIFDLEKPNIEFIKKYQLGDTITSYREITKVVRKYLEKPQLLEQIKNRMKAFKVKKFQKELPCIIDEVLKIK